MDRSNEIIVNNFKPLVVKDDYIIGARGYKICKYDLKTGNFFHYASVKDTAYSIFSQFFLTRRLFRAEVTKLYCLDYGIQLLIAKKGIFRKEELSSTFTKVFHVPRGSRPMNLCVDEKGKIFFGEYFSNLKKEPVNIYKSEDFGETWDVCYTFTRGNINHIHGIYYDSFTTRKWIVTGDRKNECIIGYTEDNFETIQEVFRGGQNYRACYLLFYKDYIIYATDSQYIKNNIKKIDRETLVIEDIREIEGSGIYGTQSRNVSMISTTVEESSVNKDQSSYLYASMDGLNWEKLAGYPKDIWHKNLFQFGSLVFPRFDVKTENDKIVFTGRAVKRIDGCTVIRTFKK